MGGGQIVYYFLGMQNMEGGPVSILQPVLAYEGNEWTGASWAGCPSNTTTTGPTIGPAKEGDRMYGSMIRTDDSTWEIVTQFNSETSKLKAQVGPWESNWAVATLEESSISSVTRPRFRSSLAAFVFFLRPAPLLVHSCLCTVSSP